MKTYFGFKMENDLLLLFNVLSFTGVAGNSFKDSPEDSLCPFVNVRSLYFFDRIRLSSSSLEGRPSFSRVVRNWSIILFNRDSRSGLFKR